MPSLTECIPQHLECSSNQSAVHHRQHSKDPSSTLLAHPAALHVHVQEQEVSLFNPYILILLLYRNKFFEMMAERADESNRRLGIVTLVPSSVVGSPAYLKKKYEDTMAMISDYGNPDIFLTFTGNPHWPEVQVEYDSSLIHKVISTPYRPCYRRSIRGSISLT